MKIKKYHHIAYEGERFTIEWYFDERGKSQALEYYHMLTIERQADALVLFKRMAESGKIFDISRFRNEGDKIFAFKPQPDRYLCFFYTGRKIIITNAFEKKSQKLPPSEKLRALAAKSNYENRVKGANYYGKK